jgi:hypothetical protein
VAQTGARNAEHLRKLASGAAGSSASLAAVDESVEAPPHA